MADADRTSEVQVLGVIDRHGILARVQPRPLRLPDLDGAAHVLHPIMMPCLPVGVHVLDLCFVPRIDELVLSGQHHLGRILLRLLEGAVGLRVLELVRGHRVLRDEVDAERHHWHHLVSCAVHVQGLPVS